MSLVLAVVVSFTIRFLVASTAFWLLDQSGVKVMSGAFAIFFSGMMLPLVLFPGWLNHYVHPYYGPAERISIAFNIFGSNNVPGFV